jgi:hypothetical protein
MKKQFWFTPQEIDLLITALEVAEPSPNRADYDSSKHGGLARYQAARFTTRRIKEMKERLLGTAPGQCANAD